MKIEPGYNRDPLAPKQHRILATDGVPDQNGNVGYYLVGQSAEPLEMLKLNVGMVHALNHKDFCGVHNASLKIINENAEEVASFDSYAVEPEEGPPNEQRVALRNRWMEHVMRWLLPASLYLSKDDPAKEKLLKRWFRRKKIAIEMRPDGGAVRVLRDGQVLSEWGC